MSDVTQILAKIEAGEQGASKELLPLVYQELRRLAAARMTGERPDHTLSATGLVHEAYLRLVDTDQVQRWDSQGHFFAAAAEAMRRILLDSAKRRSRKKRGSDLQRVSIEDAEIAATFVDDPDVLLDIDSRLEQLMEEDGEAAELAKLRLYAGLSVTEAGELLGMSRAHAYNVWRFVRSWFSVQLAD
jgi:RNA polymerase sigma factor (TIGR02999 family)